MLPCRPRCLPKIVDFCCWTFQRSRFLAWCWPKGAWPLVTRMFVLVIGLVFSWYPLHTAAALAVWTRIKTKLSYWNDTMIAFLSAAKRNKYNANHEQVATPDAANLFLAPNKKLTQNISYWCDTGILISLSKIINATSCEKMCPNSMPFLLKGHSQLWDCADLDTRLLTLKRVHPNLKSKCI